MNDETLLKISSDLGRIADALETLCDAFAQKPKPAKKPGTVGADLELAVKHVYDAYPSKCIITGRITGKSSKDKDKIATLLKTNSEHKLIDIINRYVEDCKAHNCYIKNFSTFLNNLPELPEEQRPQETPQQRALSKEELEYQAERRRMYEEQGLL